MPLRVRSPRQLGGALWPAAHGVSGRPGAACGDVAFLRARAAGEHPRRPRLLPVQGRGRPGRLRGQGALVAPAAQQLLPGSPPAAPAHCPDARRGDLSRVDPGPHRGRGDHARVQPHQGAPPALQHPPRRRQELPLPRAHHGRDLATRDGHARGEAQGHALLRSLRPRVCDPRDPRSPVALLPRADLQRREVPPPRAPWPPLPALRHRALQRTLRRRGERRGVRGLRRRADRLPRGRHRARARASLCRNATGLRRA